MGQFCDSNCTVAFIKTRVYVFDSAGSLVLDGFREKQEPVCGVLRSMPHTHIVQCKQVQPTTTTHHMSSPSTRMTTTRTACQPIYHLPSSNTAKHQLPQLCRLQSNPRKSQPQLAQPHVHAHAPQSIIAGHMICHPQKISSSISTVREEPQKSQPSNEPSRQGTTDPSQVLVLRMSPDDTAPKMQQPQFWVTSHKHQRDCGRHDGPQQQMHS